MIYAIVGFVGLVLLYLWRAGYFESAKVSVVEKPPILSESVTVYYKHVIGAYHKTIGHVEKIRSLLPAGSTAFGIFYDNPQEVKEHLLQSAVGVVFAKGGLDLYEGNYAEQLCRWGLEKMSLPVVEKAVVATHSQPSGFISAVIIPKIYKAIAALIAENRLKASPFSVEFYEGDQLSVIFPLDHFADFIVPEKLSTAELEGKLAKKKFDSDEDSSESEPSGDEEELAESDSAPVEN